MKIRSLFIPTILLTSVSFSQSQQLIRVKSTHPFDITVKQIEHALNKKNMRIFLQTDHAKGAESVGAEYYDLKECSKPF